MNSFKLSPRKMSSFEMFITANAKINVKLVFPNTLFNTLPTLSKPIETTWQM